jgi:hypothetical protein
MNIEKFASLVVKIWRLRQQRERARKHVKNCRGQARYLAIEKKLGAECRKLAA